MIAVGITAVVVIALTMFAFQTKWDFTMMGGVLFVALWLMILFSFVLMFWRSHVAELIFSSFGALLFSAYLIRKNFSCLICFFLILKWDDVMHDLELIGYIKIYV